MQTGQPNPLPIPGVDAARLDGLCAMLPAFIAVPSDDTDDSDGDDDPFYRPLMGPKGATVGELRLALGALWKSIAEDSARAVLLHDLLELALQTGADDETRIAEALERPSAKETPT